MKKIITIVSLLLALPLIYLLLTTLVFANKIVYKNEPLDYKELFHSYDSLEHFKSVTIEGSQIYSTYFYKNATYAITVFKQKTSIDELNSNALKVQMKRKKLTGYKGYTSIISEHINYRLNNDVVDSITLYIDSVDDAFTIENSDKQIYTIIPENKNFSIDFNKNKIIDFLVEKSPTNKQEYNELIIRKEGEYLYFIYLKPLDSIEDQVEILRKILKQ